MKKLHERETFRHEPIPCKGCGKLLDTTSGIGPTISEKDVKTNVAICLYCGHIRACGDEGQPTRELTAAEMLKVVTNPNIARTQRVRQSFMNSSVFGKHKN
jgi:hypothetical protein